jgi:hypothetical protein
MGGVNVLFVPPQIRPWVSAAIRCLRESAHDGARAYFDYTVTRTTQAVGYTVGLRIILSIIIDFAYTCSVSRRRASRHS